MPVEIEALVAASAIGLVASAVPKHRPGTIVEVGQLDLAEAGHVVDGIFDLVGVVPDTGAGKAAFLG